VGSEAIREPVTGLFNEVFFRATFQLRVAAARRLLRPLSLVLLEVGGIDPVQIADLARATLRDADVAARLDDGTFALILEDTPEDGAIWTAERIRRAIAGVNGAVLHAGIAGYPNQAFEADALLSQAVAALEAAGEWPQHRIETA
jgi:GGDEF domain-containing protein